LLLFSTQNADKAPSPASFAHRIAMMILFAEDLQSHMYRSKSAWTQVLIDVGLTTAPYYADKSAAIANEDPLMYPSKPKHVYLIGYDTLTRFLAPKYYPKSNPPLRALSPFFDAGYEVSVLLRPSLSSDNAVTDDTEEEQRAYISALSNGSLEKEGFKREWSKQIGILEGDDVASAVGISSTAIRKAAKYGDWGVVEKMCTPGVAAWVREMVLYDDEERGAKTA
jgi:nicotinamide-nucleotide adenylyltransferase